MENVILNISLKAKTIEKNLKERNFDHRVPTHNFNNCFQVEKHDRSYYLRCVFTCIGKPQQFSCGNVVEEFQQSMKLSNYFV